MSPMVVQLAALVMVVQPHLLLAKTSLVSGSSVCVPVRNPKLIKLQVLKMCTCSYIKTNLISWALKSLSRRKLGQTSHALQLAAVSVGPSAHIRPSWPPLQQRDVLPMTFLSWV